jgi:hypothetical protein
MYVLNTVNTTGRKGENVVFTVLRTYMHVTTVMGNNRPINGYVDTHIFTFSTCRVYCIKDVYACNHGNG